MVLSSGEIPVTNRAPCIARISIRPVHQRPRISRTDLEYLTAIIGFYY